MAEYGEATNGDAVDRIEQEGIGYAVRHYCDGSYFKDPVTADLWNKAEKALNDLCDYLERETGREVG